MESLFKFVLQRPPVKNEKDLIIDLSQNSNYQATLATSIGKENPREILKNASNQFVNGNIFIKDLSNLKIHDKIKAFQEKLNVLVKKDNITQNELKNSVKDTFGTTVAATLKDNEFLKSVEGLKDSIIAIKHLPEHHRKPIEELSNALRDLEIINKIGSDVGALKTGTLLKKYRKRSLKLPSQSDLKSILTQKEEERKRQQEVERKKHEEKKKQIKEKAELYRRLKNAIKEIMSIDHNHLESTPQQAHDGFVPPKELQPLNILKEQINQLNTLGQLKILNARTLIEKGKDAGKIINNNLDNSKLYISSNIQKSINIFSGAKIFRPISILSTQFRYRIGTENLLSKETIELLKERRLNISEVGIDKIIADLKLEMEVLSDELELLTQTQKTKSIKRIGNTMVITSIPKMSMWGHLSMIESFQEYSLQIMDKRVPRTKGSVAPSGIADLIIVKQQLKGYEGRDVAHIENILKGELKVRDHRRFNQTIEDNITETETIKVEERELESTDRFELSREASKTIQTSA